MWIARFKKALPQVLEDYPKIKFLMLTLTVRNCPVTELRQTIRQMNQAWQRLTQRSVWPAIGFVKSIEITRSSEGEAHPHIHAILAVRPSYFKGDCYLSHEKWIKLWQSCLRVDYAPIVNIKVVKPKSNSPIDDKIQSVLGGVVECLKYTIKASDFNRSGPNSQLSDAQWLENITVQLINTRAVSLGGILKEYLSEDEPEDLIHGDDDNEVGDSAEEHLTFSWREPLAKYSLLDRTFKRVFNRPLGYTEPVDPRLRDDFIKPPRSTNNTTDLQPDKDNTE